MEHPGEKYNGYLEACDRFKDAKRELLERIMLGERVWTKTGLDSEGNIFVRFLNEDEYLQATNTCVDNPPK